MQHPYVHNSYREFVMVERNSKMTDKKSKKKSKKKDGRLQKGEKIGRGKLRIKKYKKEQQDKKKRKPKKY
jgi:hypothetical protein